MASRSAVALPFRNALTSGMLSSRPRLANVSNNVVLGFDDGGVVNSVNGGFYSSADDFKALFDEPLSLYDVGYSQPKCIMQKARDDAAAERERVETQTAVASLLGNEPLYYDIWGQLLRDSYCATAPVIDANTATNAAAVGQAVARAQPVDIPAVRPARVGKHKPSAIIKAGSKSRTATKHAKHWHMEEDETLIRLVRVYSKANGTVNWTEGEAQIRGGNPDFAVLRNRIPTVYDKNNHGHLMKRWAKLQKAGVKA